MKFLKSQGIVLVLAAFAVLLVGKNLIWPFLKPKFASRPTPAAANPAATANTGAKSSALQNVAQTLASRVTDVLKTVQAQMPAAQAARLEKLDAQALRGQAANWARSPLRDPFKMRGGVNDKPARDQLKLTGILRQTDSELAVINNLILSAGEMILGFKIETVEADRVWVSGPNGREALEFKYFVQGPEKLAKEASPAPKESPAPISEATIAAQEEPAASISAGPITPREESPQESPAPISRAPLPAPAVAITAPLVRETEKGREPRRQGIDIENDVMAGPPIDR
ncbi:MAG TPA: hypothetical protein VM680_19590 [Verrucomicrobiae bacterium]|nr:hypothetical protein [Verrucomicrobiae bacterium]